jgi:hypothetical protein
MWPLVAGLITALTVLAAACDWPGAPTPKPRETATASAPTKAVTPPDTPAGAQLGWLVVAMAHLPVSEADARAHFNACYLAMISPDGLNQWLQGLNQWLDAAGGATNLVSIKVSQPSIVVAHVSDGGAGPRARRYLAADEAGKRALLANTVDRLPSPDVAAMRELGTRGDVRGLGWLASASDICRADAALAELSRRPGLSPIAQVLSINDDILELDPAQWKTTWRKGGIGPGILALAYLAATQTGQSYVVTLIAENGSQPLDPNTALPTILSATKGSFTLAARR